MNKLNEIIYFVKDILGIDEIELESDIFKLGVVGDNFHEMIDKYTKIYELDMTEYLWYFHADEEGQNLGAIFFKPPYLKVERIPVTPKLLAKYAKTKKWTIKYPKHKLPNKRYDINISKIFLIISIILIIWILKSK